MNNRSLRDVVKKNPDCATLLWQAEELATFLLTIDGNRQPLPFFTDHGIEHCRRVEEILDEIIFGPKYGQQEFDQQRAFIPNSEEAMYLLSAAYLHDIGMMYGIFSEEDRALSQTPGERFREGHERRSARYILNCWGQNCKWISTEKVYLGNLCVFHRRRHNLSEMEPAIVTGRTGETVRLRDLAAILRLADACHVDSSRTPIDMKNLFRSIGMPENAQEHLGLPRLITELHFDHRLKRIRPYCLIPRRHRYGLLEISFKPALERLLGSIRDELKTVFPYLATYSNTDFKAVEANYESPEALGGPEGTLRETWACMLSTVRSASEVACMLAAALLSVVRNAHELPRDEIANILRLARTQHPYNFLVLRLAREMEENLGQHDVHHASLCSFLNEYLERRTRACRDVAESMRNQIDHEDILVVYGYSNVVIQFLTEFLRGDRVKVIIVKIPDVGPGLAVYDESRRIQEALSTARIGWKTVDMAALTQLFAWLRARDTANKCKVLLGARGVLGDDRVLATVGNALITQAANAANVPVFVLAEPEKRLSDETVSKSVAAALAEEGERLLDISSDTNFAAVRSARVCSPIIDCLTPDTMKYVIVGADQAAKPQEA